jgi:hypothetical protein
MTRMTRFKTGVPSCGSRPTICCATFSGVSFAIAEEELETRGVYLPQLKGEVNGRGNLALVLRVAEHGGWGGI